MRYTRVFYDVATRAIDIPSRPSIYVPAHGIYKEAVVAKSLFQALIILRFQTLAMARPKNMTRLSIYTPYVADLFILDTTTPLRRLIGAGCVEVAPYHYAFVVVGRRGHNYHDSAMAAVRTLAPEIFVTDRH